MKCDCHSHNGFLTAKGLEETAQRELLSAEGLTRSGNCVMFDKVGSVSGLVEVEGHWDHELLENQYRRFLPNG